MGEHILSVAGIKKVTLELGNTSPVIVAPDADLDLVAKRCAVGAYYNSGQVCISVQRIYSQRSVYEPFTEKFVQASEAMVVGDPLDERVDVGPMIDRREVDRIEAWVNEARSDGAQVRTGGKRDGAVYWPTVLDGVTLDMEVAREETFGPIAPVSVIRDEAQALEIINRSEYGLLAAVFTRDLRRAWRFAEAARVGWVNINDSMNWWELHLPFGGRAGSRSGFGRVGGRFVQERLTELKTIVMNLA